MPRLACIRASKRNSFFVFTGHCCNFLQIYIFSIFYFPHSTQPTCLFIPAPSVTGAAAQNGIVDNHHPFHPILESIARLIAFATFFLRVTLAGHLFFYLAILVFSWIVPFECLYVMKNGTWVLLDSSLHSTHFIHIF